MSAEPQESNRDLYNLLLQTRADLQAHMKAEDRIWEEFRRRLDNHDQGISKLQQTVNNGIHEKVDSVHADMETIKTVLPEKVSRGDLRGKASHRVDIWAAVFAGIAALASVGIVAVTLIL